MSRNSFPCTKLYPQATVLAWIGYLVVKMLIN